ncbi:hypothetical protein [Burkholderia cepacia]|uniref:Uncharacterized protein n=1 Tax=Burkholderia cepacia TaxID=292 RepID=A0AA88Z4C6_BURCE|nr:hypothetical protein [Burkholderia cepacia]KGC03796.1 hypothetical protein DM43_3484 [Burkholderia cepacia]
MNAHQQNEQLDELANILLIHLTSTVGRTAPITPAMAHSPANVNPDWTLELGNLAFQRALDNGWLELIPGTNTYRISPAWLG